MVLKTQNGLMSFTILSTKKERICDHINRYKKALAKPNTYHHKNLRCTGIDRTQHFQHNKERLQETYM